MNTSQHNLRFNWIQAEVESLILYKLGCNPKFMNINQLH